MSIRVASTYRNAKGDWSLRLTGGLYPLTRTEAEQLRDDLTAALNDHTGETPAERAHRELHDGTDTCLPPERAA